MPAQEGFLKLLALKWMDSDLAHIIAALPYSNNEQYIIYVLWTGHLSALASWVYERVQKRKYYTLLYILYRWAKARPKDWSLGT